MQVKYVWSGLKEMLLRHRIGIRDGGLLVGIVVTAGLIAFEYDISGNLDDDKRVEFRELLALAALVTFSIFFFGWRRMVEQEHEIERRVAAERRAHELANTDPLTGLPNRRQFEQALREAIASPPGADRVHALLMLDLNGFKAVNDVYGHPQGDDLLVEVARRLSSVMRQGDLLARLGGDEFAIVALHLAGPEAANSIALRIIKSLDTPVNVRSTHHRIGTGIGISLVPNDGTSADDLLRKADIALYRAKADLRSGARFFESAMDERARERSFLEQELASAIGTDALQPWYQAIVDLQTRKVIGFEALARWNHPSLGNIPPDRFIPVAEECGLIRDLSKNLLRRACRDARRWPADTVLSFNISPEELKDRTLGLTVLSILGECGLSPDRLEIEITESALVRDLDAAKAVLSDLRTAGVRIALDDFGTGYSSLYHLRNFKFDKIKIDRSFVESMGSEEESAAIVRALSGLGRGLGLTITAEGIEHSDQRDVLVSQGCQQGQGFLFSRAVPAAEAEALFADPLRKELAAI
jgi:diguanylate cyclase (GGDEF)-like protein